MRSVESVRKRRGNSKGHKRQLEGHKKLYIGQKDGVNSLKKPKAFEFLFCP